MPRSSTISSLLGRSLSRSTSTPIASTGAFLRPFPSASPASSTCSLLARSFSSTPRRWDSALPQGISAPKGSSTSSDGTSEITATWHPADGSESKAPLKVDQEPKLSLTFTCTATVDAPSPESTPDSPSPPTPQENVICNHRSTHIFSKQAYTKGIVLVQCPSCENRHLIADHLGWFPEVTEADGGKRVMRNIQEIMKEKGEEVKRGALRGGEGGTVEFY